MRGRRRLAQRPLYVNRSQATDQDAEKKRSLVHPRSSGIQCSRVANG